MAHLRKQLTLFVSDKLIAWGFMLGVDYRTEDELQSYIAFINAQLNACKHR